MKDSKRFISEAEFETIYGIPKRTLQKWRLFGKGARWVRFGSSVRYDVNQIELWIASLPTGGGHVHDFKP